MDHDSRHIRIRGGGGRVQRDVAGASPKFIQSLVAEIFLSSDSVASVSKNQAKKLMAHPRLVADPVQSVERLAIEEDVFDVQSYQSSYTITSFL